MLGCSGNDYVCDMITFSLATFNRKRFSIGVFDLTEQAENLRMMYIQIYFLAGIAIFYTLK